MKKPRQPLRVSHAQPLSHSLSHVPHSAPATHQRRVSQPVYLTRLPARGISPGRHHSSATLLSTLHVFLSFSSYSRQPAQWAVSADAARPVSADAADMSPACPQRRGPSSAAVGNPAKRGCRGWPAFSGAAGVCPVKLMQRATNRERVGRAESGPVYLGDSAAGNGPRVPRFEDILQFRPGALADLHHPPRDAHPPQADMSIMTISPQQNKTSESDALFQICGFEGCLSALSLMETACK